MLVSAVAASLLDRCFMATSVVNASASHRGKAIFFSFRGAGGRVHVNICVYNCTGYIPTAPSAPPACLMLSRCFQVSTAYRKRDKLDEIGANRPLGSRLPQPGNTHRSGPAPHDGVRWHGDCSRCALHAIVLARWLQPSAFARSTPITRKHTHTCTETVRSARSEAREGDEEALRLQLERPVRRSARRRPEPAHEGRQRVKNAALEPGTAPTPPPPPHA